MVVREPVSAAASPPPLTPRGLKTRTALKAAARQLFELKGFQGTSVSQISALAEVSHGSFYTYFDSKEHVFAEVTGELFLEFNAVIDALPPAGDDLSERIERANRGYLLAYQRNGRIMAALEQATMLSGGLAEIRRAARVRWIERNAKAIRRWQRRGLVAPTLDARSAAEILGSMVDRTAFVAVVLDERDDLEQTVVQLSRLYSNALGLPYHRDSKHRRKASERT